MHMIDPNRIKREENMPTYFTYDQMYPMTYAATALDNTALMCEPFSHKNVYYNGAIMQKDSFPVIFL